MCFSNISRSVESECVYSESTLLNPVNVCIYCTPVPPLKTSVSHVNETFLPSMDICTMELLLNSFFAFFSFEKYKDLSLSKIMVIYFEKIIVLQMDPFRNIKSKRINTYVNNNFKTYSYNFFNDLQYKRSSRSWKLWAEEMSDPENVTFHLMLKERLK